jgi:hypothetical protein
MARISQWLVRVLQIYGGTSPKYAYKIDKIYNIGYDIGYNIRYDIEHEIGYDIGYNIGYNIGENI